MIPKKTTPLAFVFAGLMALPALGQEVTPQLDPAQERNAMLWFACNHIASERILSADEGSNCTAIGIQIKVSFTGMPWEEFLSLSFADRHPVNMQGYALFRDWQTANPDIVEALTEQGIEEFTTTIVLEAPGEDA